MDLKGTQTEKNLLIAFAGESQARSRYTYFAKQAKKEGFKQIEAVFALTAEQELVHAKRFFRFLQGGDLEITAAFPAGKIGTTAENLLAAAEGEHHEHSSMYPEMARVAREEGFEAVATVFDNVSIAEKYHEERYRNLLKNVEAGTVFKKEKPVRWICRNCGYAHEGTEAPDNCPACNHPQAYFEVAPDNY